MSTVEESILEILRSHQAENLQPPLYYGHPECYELRLHDADGYPDEDFPGKLLRLWTVDQVTVPNTGLSWQLWTDPGRSKTLATLVVTNTACVNALMRAPRRVMVSYVVSLFLRLLMD